MNNITILQCVYSGDDVNHFSVACDSVIKSCLGSKVRWMIVVDGPVCDLMNEKISGLANIKSVDVVRLEKNVGLPLALNAGLTLIETEWVLRFDSDDVMSDNWIKTAQNLIENNADSDVITCDVEEFEKDIGDVKQIKALPSKVSPYIYYRNPVNHMAVLYRVKFAKQIAGYPNITGFEDYALWWKFYINKAKFKFIKTPYVYARIGNGYHQRRSGKRYIQSNLKFEKFRIRNSRFHHKLLLMICIPLRFFSLLLNNCLNGLVVRMLLRKRL